MDLKGILNMTSEKDKQNYKKQGMSEDRLFSDMKDLQNIIAYFRQYPDIFIDFIKGEDSSFEFFFYQRI